MSRFCLSPRGFLSFALGRVANVQGLYICTLLSTSIRQIKYYTCTIHYLLKQSGKIRYDLDKNRGSF